MVEKYNENKIYNNQNFAVRPLAKGTYENCRFLNSDFSNTSLSECQFIDCVFENCNLSMADLQMTTLKDVIFKHCKMIGIRFDTCSQFTLSFEFNDCSLNHTSFYKTKIRKTVFTDCILHGTDFTECDLSESIFNNCDFSGATFERTIIEKADFYTSYNYSIDPENNRIKKAKFSLQSIDGLLTKYDIIIKS